MHRFALALVIGCCGSYTASALELKPDDNICIIGNALAERMQHDGWLETLLHARFPQYRLVIRNLGYSGDEIDGWQNFHSRLRSMDFGTQDQWLSGKAPVPQPKKLGERDQGKFRDNRFELTNTNADVIFAFYGYNESFAGEAGLPQFQEKVAAFIQHTLAQKYNGQTAPRLVLFSPPPLLSTGDPNLPSPSAIAAANERLKRYTEAMGEVARRFDVAFVDLWTPLAQATPPHPSWTINGLHWTAEGNFVLAQTIMASLFGAPPLEEEARQRLEPLRQAVLAKNFYWFNRYRVTDGYSTYGDRAFLRFSEGPGGYGEGLSNYTVGQRELEILDLMTANRDRVIWAVANGQLDARPDDGNLPDYIPVISNKPGPLEGGRHLFLGGEAAISKMTLGSNLEIKLFASEELFPELVNPVQMAFDTKGRLWVAAWASYPHWRPTDPMNDKLLILEDIDADGRADVCKTFAGDLHNPTGFEFWNNGVIVAQGPDILFLQDTNGDDHYDLKERILHGLDTADTHHTANSFTFDPGGALYFQEGTFHHSQVESVWGPPRRVANGAVFRYEPRSQKIDVYVSFGFANPHGHAFDYWGQDVVYDGTGAQPYHAALFSGHIDYPHKHGRPPQVYQQRTRPCPGIEYLSSSHFPEEFRGNLLVGNVIGFQGILRYKVSGEGSSFSAVELEPIVYSTDPNFRPADLETGPDGALYFTDWQNPIIGHMQHNLRDPNRDKSHGRVYRVNYQGRPLLTPRPIAGQPVPRLIELLTEKDDRVRYRAKIELSGRPTAEVLAAVQAWLRTLDPQDPDYEHHVLEALWLHQHHNVVDVSLLNRVLGSPRFEARAAAVRVLCYWRDRVPNALEICKKLAQDDHPRVRLEAVRAASFFTEPEAIEVPLIAAEFPSDPPLDFVRAETQRTLEPLVKSALARGQRLQFTTEAGARYFLRNLPNEQLLKEERNRPVLLEMLYRPGLRDEHRREAIEGLARLDNKPELAVIMDAIRWLDEKQSDADVGVVFDLVRQLAGRSSQELHAARQELEQLATSARQPVFRQIGFVALINVDGTVEPAWHLASRSVRSLLDFVNAMPLLSDPNVRATLYDKVAPLLQELPEPLRAHNASGTLGRYVRIEIPGRAILTLAEVEVLSGGENIAPRGRASQKNTAHGGDARRAIDGNKSGAYGDGGQTHTEENTGNPWWELDLGSEQPIDQIVVYNRTDGDLGRRLSGWTLKVLDHRRNEVFKRTDLPSPAVSASFDLAGSGPQAIIRRAAMQALTHVRGQETRTFQLLVPFVNSPDQAAAVSALQRLPKTSWPADQAQPLIDVLLASIRKTPTAERTSPAALAAMEFAFDLASLLPGEQARRVRAELRDLGVRVIRLGTLFERMAFDKDVLVVEAGRPVEFLLENTDLMPHNFAITAPGALEEIGLLSEAHAQQPGFAERHYIPQSDKILLSSKLLQPRDTQKLSFTAPKQPGVYPYVCTYPGHWRRMHGALYVVPDLDAYEANPEAYLAAQRIAPVDPLLKDRRPRTEWKLADLADAVAELKHGRNFAAGKQMFTVANCVACHKLEGVGNQFGPDLLKLEPKPTLTELLQAILEPSHKIHEKYQTQVFVLFSGKTITGLVVEESGDVIKVVENPLVSTQPVAIKRSDVEERQRSTTSLMPKGLLDKLTRDEILDLLAYVASGGNKQHPLFHAEGHHHH
jgi:putative heme-binding domain-containing protein